MDLKREALIAWDKACLPKSHWALGVLDITTHNQALPMKNLHKFLNKEDTPWVNIIWELHYSNSLPGNKVVGSFWWKTVLKILLIYKEYAICKDGNGNSTLFWTDKWFEQPFNLAYPKLFS